MKNNFVNSRALLALSISVCSGCTTVNMAEDTKAAAANAPPQLAHISGDYHVTAGAPVSVLLRSVDDQPLKFWQTAVDVNSGEHRLLVDCRVKEGEKLSRYELNVSVDANVSYALVADANPQYGCTAVRLEVREK